MKITSEGTRGEEPRAPLFSFWNSANIGALPGIHFCLSTTSTTVTSARYPTKASTIITYALSPKSSVYILLHRHGLDGLLASVQFDDDSAHFNSHITRNTVGLCRRCRYNLCARTKKREVGQTSERDKTCMCLLPSPHILVGLTFPFRPHQNQAHRTAN